MGVPSGSGASAFLRKARGEQSLALSREVPAVGKLPDSSLSRLQTQG